MEDYKQNQKDELIPHEHVPFPEGRIVLREGSFSQCGEYVKMG